MRDLFTNREIQKIRYKKIWDLSEEDKEKLLEKHFPKTEKNIQLLSTILYLRIRRELIKIIKEEESNLQQWFNKELENSEVISKVIFDFNKDLEEELKILKGYC